jgi:hypothetical protein
LNIFQRSPSLPFQEGLYFEVKNLVLRAKSELNGFAGKDSELFWSTGVLEKAKIGIST